ncbi:SDR family NAD(P)-dependent oxidoreductase [Streptomyces sp. NPDC051016]|uniref:SDR family NAD(P)-dependent oxidoreductase n=1 Tax=Streptomyces sp. NPDC051016 TaxID=3365638 RepID=UPI0037BDB112
MTVDANTGLSLASKVAIVTGAGQGLGRDIALAMARAGARVAVVDLNPETAQKVAAERGGYGKAGIAIPCDVSRREEVRAAVERTVSEWGGIDLLVDNAHNLGAVQARCMDTDDEHLLRHLNSGLFGTYYFLQESYEYLKARGAGSSTSVRARVSPDARSTSLGDPRASGSTPSAPPPTTPPP